MAKPNSTPLILRVTYTHGYVSDFEVANKHDMRYLLNKVTQAIDEHKSVELCENIIINTNNVIYVEVIDNGY